MIVYEYCGGGRRKPEVAHTCESKNANAALDFYRVRPPGTLHLTNFLRRGGTTPSVSAWLWATATLVLLASLFEIDAFAAGLDVSGVGCTRSRAEGADGFKDVVEVHSPRHRAGEQRRVEKIRPRAHDGEIVLGHVQLAHKGEARPA